jgi:hypothetical protein
MNIYIIYIYIEGILLSILRSFSFFFDIKITRKVIDEYFQGLCDSLLSDYEHDKKDEIAKMLKDLAQSDQLAMSYLQLKTTRCQV